MAVSRCRFGCSSNSLTFCHPLHCSVCTLFSLQIGSDWNRQSVSSQAGFSQKPIPICGVVQQDRSCFSSLPRLRRSIPKTSSYLLSQSFLYILHCDLCISLSHRQLIWGFCFLCSTNPKHPMADHSTLKQVVAQVFQNQDARPMTKRLQDDSQNFEHVFTGTDGKSSS